MGKNQKWIGGMLAPSAAMMLQKIALKLNCDFFKTIGVGRQTPQPLFIEYDIPLKSPLPVGCPRAAINLKIVGDSLGGGPFVPPKKAREGTLNSDAVEKRTNTRVFLQSIEKQGASLAIRLAPTMTRRRLQIQIALPDRRSDRQNQIHRYQQ